MFGKDDIRRFCVRAIFGILCVMILPVLGIESDSHLLAQAPASDKGVSASKVERLNLAPVSKEILRVKLPSPVEATLDNGVTVMIMEDHRFPTVSLQLQINGAGGIHEPSNQRGLATATAQMMREGTKSRSSKQIAEDVDKLGATLGVFSGFGSTTAVLSASGLSDNFDEWFGLFMDVLLNPTFPADELEKMKTRLRVQLRQQRSQPGFLANERYDRVVYGDHPAAVSGFTEESIAALASEALATWHRDRYVPQGALLGIAGDVTAKELIPKLRKWFAAWKKTDLRVSPPADPKPIAAQKVSIVDRPNSVQTTLTMGNIAIDRVHPDYIGLTVMNRVLGGGPAARLFINLREEKGYTYGVYSYFSAGRYAGPWTAGGDVRTEVTDGAMTEFMKEFNRMRDEKVPPAELDECKRSLVANFALSLEQPTQLLSYALTRKFYNLPVDYWDTYPAKLMAVSADEVQQVARKYIDPGSMQIVAVGDAGKIEEILGKYGPIEVYDIEGKKMK